MSGRYVAERPTNVALADIVERASNKYGEWERSSPSGHPYDVTEMAAELLRARQALAAADRLADAADRVHDMRDRDPDRELADALAAYLDARGAR